LRYGSSNVALSVESVDWCIMGLVTTGATSDGLQVAMRCNCQLFYSCYSYSVQDNNNRMWPIGQLRRRQKCSRIRRVDCWRRQACTVT